MGSTAGKEIEHNLQAKVGVHVDFVILYLYYDRDNFGEHDKKVCCDV